MARRIKALDDRSFRASYGSSLMVHTEDLKPVIFIRYKRTRSKVELVKLYSKEAMSTSYSKAKLTLPSVKPSWCFDPCEKSQVFPS